MPYNNGVYTPYNPYAYTAQPAPAYYQQYAQQPAPTPQQMPQAVQQQPVQQTVQAQPQQPAQAQQTAQTQGYAYTNEIFVTSKEDALNRQVPFNSSVTYLHQDKPFGFQVVTDAQGKKTCTPFRLTPCTDEELKEETTAVAMADLSAYVTKDDLMAALADLENKLKRDYKQVAATPKKKKVIVEDDDDEE